MRPVTLRSTHWDGPSPCPGDVLATRAGSWYVVQAVAQGAGVGHFRLDCAAVGHERPHEADDPSAQVFRWSWDRR